MKSVVTAEMIETTEAEHPDGMQLQDCALVPHRRNRRRRRTNRVETLARRSADGHSSSDFLAKLRAETSQLLAKEVRQTQEPLARVLKELGIKALDPMEVERFQVEYKQKYCEERAREELKIEHRESKPAWRNRPRPDSPSFKEIAEYYDWLTRWNCRPLALYQEMSGSGAPTLPLVPKEAVEQVQEIPTASRHRDRS